MFPGSISIDEIFNRTGLAGQVAATGWMYADVADGCDDLELRAERIAKLLGEPIKGRAGRLVDALAPMDKENAKPSSLSVIHGLGSFPFHTDGAHLLQARRSRKRGGPVVARSTNCGRGMAMSSWIYAVPKGPARKRKSKPKKKRKFPSSKSVRAVSGG